MIQAAEEQKEFSEIGITIGLGSCPRCENPHTNLRFTPLTKPSDQFSMMTFCPLSGQPLLMAIIVK